MGLIVPLSKLYTTRIIVIPDLGFYGGNQSVNHYWAPAVITWTQFINLGDHQDIQVCHGALN